MKCPLSPIPPFHWWMETDSEGFRHQAGIWWKRKMAVLMDTLYLPTPCREGKYVERRGRSSWGEKKWVCNPSPFAFRKRLLLPDTFFTLPWSLLIRNPFGLIFEYPEMIKETTILSLLPLSWFNKHLFTSLFYWSFPEGGNRITLSGS